MFTNAVAESSWTVPSHVSMLTGLYPSTHRVENEIGRARIGSKTTLVSSMLRDAGYETFALTGGNYLSPKRGFDQGFDSFEKVPDFGPLDVVLGKARERIEARDSRRPYFAFLHTYDVHCPYHPPEPFYSMFESEGAEPMKTVRRCDKWLRKDGVNAARARYLSDRYDGSIRRADEMLGEFLDFLGSTGALEHTVVVITSDHGEEFFEHGRVGHGWTLHREVLMVPLVIRAPSAAPRRVDHFVGLVDLVPTLLELAGLPIPASIEGGSLVAMMRGEPPGPGRPRFRLSELDLVQERRVRLHLASRIDNRTHLIADLTWDRALLYDFQKDFAEQDDLSAERGPAVAALRRELLASIADKPKRYEAEPRGALTDEEREELRALGYTED